MEQFIITIAVYSLTMIVYLAIRLFTTNYPRTVVKDWRHDAIDLGFFAVILYFGVRLLWFP